MDSLPVYNGFSCTRCRYLTTIRDNITRHWRTTQDHNGGGSRCTDVKLQSWLKGKCTRYWIVREAGEVAAAAAADDTDRKSSMETMLHEYTEKLEEEDAAWLRKGDAEEGIDRDSAWVKRVRWVPHFGSRDKLAIFHAAEWVRARTQTARWKLAEDDEASRERTQLLKLGESFDREVDRCCWRLTSVPAETLQWLASITASMPQGVPFGLKAKETSMSKYRSVGHRYLGMCWRAHRIGRKQAADQWAIRFTERQWGLLVDMVHELEVVGSRHGDQTDEASGTSGDEGGDDDYDSFDAARARRPDDALETSALDRAVYMFLVASIQQQVGGDIYESPLLSFCAALGITAQPLGFTQPHLYTGLLAAILWWVRLFFLEAQFEGQSREAEQVGVEAVLAFREAHAKWMCTGCHTVVSTMISWMAYGKGYRKKMGGQPSIRWSDDGEVLFHSGEAIVIDTFKHTARELVTETEKVLDRLMGGAWARVSKELDMGRIVDNMVKLGAGKSFVNNPANKWLQPGPAKVVQLLGSSIWNATQSRWKKVAVRAWLRQLRVMRTNLLALTHIWQGQPGRGPEVMTMRHCDSWQLIRNVFLLDGQVMIVTDRDKMKAIRDMGHKVARFLPDRIGRMMVAYIAWLLPTERMLRRSTKLTEPSRDQLEFLWRDGDSPVWGTERLSIALRRVMEAGTGVRISVGRYRPIAIEMGRRIRGMVIRQQETQLDDEDDEDNVEVDPITGQAVDCGGSWNIVWDIQSTHGTRIARQHYGVHIGFPGQLQPEMIATFREISRLWHQFLESEKTEDGGAVGSKRRAGPTMCGRPSKAAKHSPIDVKGDPDTEDTMDDGLRQLFGPEGTWRSEKQRASMDVIMGLRAGESMISILPTGAGKSVLFMVPAVLREGGISIVVVPFLALMDDLVERAGTMGVDCIRFRATLSSGRDGLPRAARLVVVSADIVSTPEFSAYADGLLCTGLLRRIFIDECHTVITDIGYRARLGELSSLHRYGCPMILLTATLPVVLEDWFRKEMLVPSAITVRDRTVKPNCQYQVQQVRPGEVQKRTVELVGAITARMSGHEKGVVYCRSRGQCVATAEAIGCDAHHSGMDEKEREEARQVWAEGRGHQWIVATSGLGTGIDIEGIVAVVHMERPWGLVDFVQQAGRGGRRAGDEMVSVIVHDGRPGRVQAHASFVDASNQAQMDAYITTPGCRRAVISAFMDGVAGERCWDVDGARLCDGCEKERQGGKATTVGTWTKHGLEEGQRVRTMLRWLEEVAETCAVCHVKRQLNGVQLNGVASRRGWDERQDEERGYCCAEVGGVRCKEARGAVQFGPLSCCYMCKLPP